MTPNEKAQVRNETIDELCDWLQSCVQNVDADSEVFKACMSMVNAMRGKKMSIVVDTSYPDEKHYPLRTR